MQSFNEGSSNAMIGLLTAIPQFLYYLRNDLLSRRSDRLQERKMHTALPYLFAAAGWVLAAMTSHPVIQLIGIIMASTVHLLRWQCSGQPQTSQSAYVLVPSVLRLSTQQVI